jgi:hypothetical protein
MRLRFRRAGRTSLGVALGALWACAPPPSPPGEDVVVTPRDACVGASCRDAGARDATIDTAVDVVEGTDAADAAPAMDASEDASADVVEEDAPLPDGAVVAGRCTGVMPAPLVLGSEPRQLARRVFVGQSSAGFFAGYTVQSMGVDSVAFQRISPVGALVGSTNVAPDFEGSRMGGGAFAVTPTGFASALHSNARPGGLDIYLQRLDSMGARSGAVVRVSDDRELSEDPQVARTSRGEVVVWRSTMDMLGGQRLLASLVSGPVATPPVSVTPMMTDAAAFDVATDGERVMVALIARSGGNGNAFLMVLDAAGALQRTVQLTTGAFLTEAISVALLGTDAVVAWTDRRPEGTLRLRRVNVETGVAGPISIVPGFGFDVSQAAIATDRDGLAVAFRTTTPMGPRISVGRIGPTLALREGASAIAPAGPGDQVRIVARGDGTFGIAWADETSVPMSTTAKFQVVRCP